LGATGEAWLRVTPVIVPHPRIAQSARELGFTCVLETGTGDEALAAAATRELRRQRFD
jgi:uroporphyrinogen-III synthase